MRCFAYSIVGNFDVKLIVEKININFSIKQYDEAYHVKLNLQQIPNSEGDLFLFKFGSIVAWGLNQEIEQSIIEIIQKVCVTETETIDDDEYTYGYGDRARIEDDFITLPDRSLYSKLAFSYGLAQTVKLGSFEFAIEKKIQETKDIPVNLANYGNILLSRSDIRKMMGRLFMDRSQINLHMDFLDSPDFFWEREKLEPIHEFTTEYFLLEKRVNILNQKLDVLQEILDILTTELQHQHSSRLEVTIIVLILIETVIMVGKEVIQII